MAGSVLLIGTGGADHDWLVQDYIVQLVLR